MYTAIENLRFYFRRSAFISRFAFDANISYIKDHQVHNNVYQEIDFLFNYGIDHQRNIEGRIYGIR